MVCRATDVNALEIDFGAVELSMPHLTLSSSIGNGFNSVAKFLSTKLAGRSETAQALVNYLLSMNHHGDVCYQIRNAEKINNIKYINKLFLKRSFLNCRN